MSNENSSLKARWQLQIEILAIKFSALFTASIGFVNLISAVQPALQKRLEMIQLLVPIEVRYGSRMTSAFAGFALLLLAGSLWRRKRTAWVLTMILLVISFFTHLTKGLDYEEASLTLSLIILLVLFRRSFFVTSDRPSLQQGLKVLAYAFGFTLNSGTAGFYLLDKHFNVSFSILDALKQTLVMFTSFYNPGLEPITGFGKYFADSIYVIGLGTFGFALLMLIRPVLVRQLATSEERTRAEGAIEKYGRTALARAALFNDKSYFFGPGNTVIAYAVSGRGAIALGDPIGPTDQVATTIADFLNFCTKNDWTPAFASTLPDFLDSYKAAGFEAVCIGFEAIIKSGKIYP